MKTSKSQSDAPMTLQDLFVVKLQSLYDVENVLIKALPKMAKHATDPELTSAFETHLRETEEHAKRIERSLTILDEKIKKTKVEGIRGIVTDAEWVIANVQGDAALDSALIASAQYAEHYEMAGYGTARNWAGILGHSEIEEMLRQTLEEEKNADETLNSISISINARADVTDDEDEEDIGIEEEML